MFRHGSLARGLSDRAETMRRKRIHSTKQEILELETRAREHVESVPYAVSLRWVFYRLLQDGIYSKKGDWGRWKALASNFRHNGIWPPDFLEDSTREVVRRGIHRPYSKQEIIEGFLSVPVLTAYLTDSHFTRQGSYVEIWFEARAMLGQFEQHTKGVVLRPFGGDYTIGPKYQAAKELMQNASRFGKPAKVLYFGDCDEKGRKIFKAATTGPRGLMKWCDIDVEWVWCGLTKEQAEEFDIPENPEKPGQYQWEALTDEAAREIISRGVQEHLDLSLIATMEQEAARKAKRFASELRKRLG
jgi:hypothetical protein